MLRTLQTRAFSNTIANLFDKPAEDTQLKAQPRLADIKCPSNDRVPNADVSELLVRRRRARRNRVMASANASRAAWV